MNFCVLVVKVILKYRMFFIRLLFIWWMKLLNWGCMSLFVWVVWMKVFWWFVLNWKMVKIWDIFCMIFLNVCVCVVGRFWFLFLVVKLLILWWCVLCVVVVLKWILLNCCWKIIKFFWNILVIIWNCRVLFSRIVLNIFDNIML